MNHDFEYLTPVFVVSFTWNAVDVFNLDIRTYLYTQHLSMKKTPGFDNTTHTNTHC